MRRILVVIGVALVVLVVGIATVPPLRTTARTLGLLPELMDLGIRPLSAVTGTPTTVRTTYGATAPDRMDVYLPADATPTHDRPALVLSLGVHPVALDHPDIVRVAQGICRLGVVVGVPDSSALRDTRITPEEPGRLAEAVLVLAARPEVDPDRVGLAGFSAGASVALVAAADPRIVDRVRFIGAFGGYADAETLLVDIATRSTEVDGSTRPWSPEPGIRRDVVGLLVRTIGSSADRDRLEAVLGPIVDADEPPRGPDMAVLGSFSDPDVAAAYRLFTAATRADARAAITAASAGVRGHLAAISPASVLDRIRAPVYLLHGENDRSIPVAHARSIAAGLPPGVLRRATFFSSFQHEQPGKRGVGLDELPDVLELYRYLHDIVARATE